MNIVKTTYNCVDSFDITDLVNDALGATDYSFIATQECGNDTSHVFHVIGADAPSYLYNPEEMEAWVAGNGREFTSNVEVMNHLCAKGLIEPGHYLVDVCW